MPNRRRLLAPLLVLLASACSTVSVNQDYAQDVDFTSYQSFDWFPGQREVAGEGGVSDPFLEERVRNAVTRELTAKGLRKGSGGSPDFWVNYHVSVQQKLTSSGVSVGYGVGGVGSWGGVGVGMRSNPVRQYEEGTLVIDFIDGRSRKLVWRGSGSKALARNPTPEDTTRTVDQATHEILKQFPPGQE